MAKLHNDYIIQRKRAMTYKECEDCEGMGFHYSYTEKDKRCTTCNGKGVILVADNDKTKNDAMNMINELKKK